MTSRPLNAKRHSPRYETERAHIIGGNSTRARGNNLSGPSKLLPFIDEREAAERFSAVAQDFSTGQLAQLGRATKGSAKNWKAGRVFPNGATLINLARNHPAIKKWLLHQIGEAAEYESPEYIDRLVRAEVQRAIRDLK